MLIPISRRIELRVSVPLRINVRDAAQLELALPREVREVSAGFEPEGYRLRTYRESDENSLVGLLRRAGFDFTMGKLRDVLLQCLPGGCFVVEHGATEALAATMMGRHLASPAHPFGGRIDWLASDPDHRGRGLATLCARSATRRLLESGYEDIWVTTDDHRLGAIKIFLGIGFRPAISDENRMRWRRVFEQLALSNPSRKNDSL
jgi:mycothiol synthase